MNVLSSSTSTLERSDADNELETRLLGRWLFFVRAAWIVLTLSILGLNVASLPNYHAVVQTACAAPEHCFRDQFTPAWMQSLHTLGVSVGVFATVYVAVNGLSVLVWVLLGSLLFWRRSDEPMALFCSFMLVSFGGASVIPMLEEGLAPISLGWYVLVNFLYFLGQVFFVLFFYLFPTGRFVPRWTRWTGLLLVGYNAWTIITFHPGTFTSLAEALVFCGLFLTLIVAQVYRYWCVSTPSQQQQTKWVVFAFVLVIVGFMGLYFAGQIIFIPMGNPSITVFLIGFVGFTAINLIFLLIPFSIAIAILRSRLWDIDIIINRTLVYATLTALLALVYFGLIFAIQFLLRGIISQNNSIAIVVSTLAIAALFGPLRRRIQVIIDRRFYRRKYDAAKVVEAFSATLRNEVDLNQLNEHLLTVVKDTMQPSHVSLWLRQPTHKTTPFLQSKVQIEERIGKYTTPQQ